MRSPQLHPRHGTHDPSSATPLRRPGSLRRTTSIDSRRPEGFAGPINLVAHGRDLITDADGSSHPVADVSATALVAGGVERRLISIDVEPSEPGLIDLIGTSVRSGFRGRVVAAMPEHAQQGTLLHLLLDDLPLGVMLTGQAAYAAGHIPASGPSGTPDICSGWRTDGTILLHIATNGRPPAVTGPASLPQTRADDPLAWHQLPELPAHAMRRLRRIDVLPSDDALHFEGFFRDSHMSDDGAETSIHEYTFAGAIDRATMRFSTLNVRAHALPWQECPSALTSADRLIGQAVNGLRQHVRNNFQGIGTCTHLNDTLRNLEDLPILAGLIS